MYWFMSPTLLLVVLALCTPAQADPLAEGKLSFEQKCTGCHTIGGGDHIGPDLHGVTGRRSKAWILRFIMAPERMIAENDPTVVRLVEKYNRIVMPNLGLSGAEARALLAYLASASAAGEAPAGSPPAAARLPRPTLAAPQSTILIMFLILSAVIVTVFAWIALSTRSPAEVDIHKAYGVRRIFFLTAAAALVSLLLATLPRTPYAKNDLRPDRIVYVTARQFDFIFSDAPITQKADLGRTSRIEHLEFEPGSLIEFRVTSLDVNHGFGLFGPGRRLLTQTQAMPGYVNRLFVRLDEAGQYKVFCLEYCAAGHHLMQHTLTVK